MDGCARCTLWSSSKTLLFPEEGFLWIQSALSVNVPHHSQQRDGGAVIDPRMNIRNSNQECGLLESERALS